MPTDPTRLDAFLGKAIGDLGAAMSATLMLLGDRLGLYKALAREPASSSELAHRTGTHERYVREWLGNMVTARIVEYDAAKRTYWLPHADVVTAIWKGRRLRNDHTYSEFNLFNVRTHESQKAKVLESSSDE